GTVAGTMISFFLLKDKIPFLDNIGAMISASYVGVGVNFASIAAKFVAPGEMVSAAVVADNLMMALYCVILMLIPSLTFFRKRFTHSYVLEVEQQNTNGEGNSTLAESFWKRNEISLKDIALSVGTAFLLVIVSFKIA